MYIVAFNGPPRSGKDTLARMLNDFMDSQGVSLPVKEESLSMPLRQIAYATVGYQGALDGPEYELFKTTHYGLLGVTGRQLMIDVSEKFLKPTYGIGVMAKLLLERNEGFHGVLLIRDSGFQCEVDPLVAAIGAENLLLVRCVRDGFTFAGDSREYVTKPDLGWFSLVQNNGTLVDLETQAAQLYVKMIGKLGWRL